VQGTSIGKHTPSATAAVQTPAQGNEKRRGATPTPASSQQARRHRQQPASQAQELHGSSCGAGNEAQCEAAARKGGRCSRQGPGQTVAFVNA
jgi:hypothetical protein